MIILMIDGGSLELLLLSENLAELKGEGRVQGPADQSAAAAPELH